MQEKIELRSVSMDTELRLIIPAKPGYLARILKILREKGGSLHGHLFYRLADQIAAHFLCDQPAEASLALKTEGIPVETAGVVRATAERRPGALSHLLSTLEVEGLEVLHSYTCSSPENLQVVFGTSDNPKAEDILRNYLILPDRFQPEP